MPKDKRKDYIFNNPADTNYLKVGHHEDMGAPYGHHYIFRDNIPDAEYLVFVDGKIQTKGYMKNSKKEGTWSHYDIKEKLRLTYRYTKGVPNGESVELLTIRGKELVRKSDFKNGKMVQDNVYDDKGKLISRTDDK